MPSILKSIALNERSYNVNLLHKALKALGYPVIKSEVSQSKVGKETLKQVRKLQEHLNVAVDDSILVNEVTSTAIVKALKEKGLTDTSRSFTVTGTVKSPDGKVKKGQKLLAFDLDLRGVSAFRTIKSIAEIMEIGGFEFLGDVVSNKHGEYSITFYDFQYRQAERKKADVVVYAVEAEEKKTPRVVGHSRMVNSDDYSDKGLVRDLDVFIKEKDSHTEHALLMNKLNAFLKESQTSLAAIASSRDQLTFTAGELEIDLPHLDLTASATLLLGDEKQLSHELFYGIGRQGIKLLWPILYKKQDDELRSSITKSEEEGIIRKFTGKEIDSFLHAISQCSAKHMLEDKDGENKNSFNAMLKNALPKKEQRLSFALALNSFKGNDYREFWHQYLPDQPQFKNTPDLVDNLLLTQQFTILTGNHQSLVKELQLTRGYKSPQELMELEKSDWLNIIRKTGVPGFINGENDDEKISTYAELLQSLLNETFPTTRIARMVEKNELPIEKISVSKGISNFLSKTDSFDFASSRIHDFKKEIKAVAEKDYDAVRSELMKIQRVFQVCASPESMNSLMESKLDSAYTISNIPRNSFIKKYAGVLGGDKGAYAIHQRASHIATRSEMNATHLMEYSHGYLPKSVMDVHEYEKSMAVIKAHMPNPTPNYIELFGRADVCECKHCRSVYSSAAYFVDLLRFLSRGNTNGEDKTPLGILKTRRPDLLELPLTCENTNTLIPYIDLVNEVMEFYTVHGVLDNFSGFDTGELTEEELRANPQNVDVEAYRKLKDVKYPFNLPYHQPLDVIRTYSDHLTVSRYDALKAMSPHPDATSTKAIEAESLRFSQEEYAMLTGKFFDDSTDATEAHEFFGYVASGDLEGLSQVPEFLQRTGVKYTDLIEIVKSRFINPYQDTLDFLEAIFSFASADANTIYSWLEQVVAGTLSSADRDTIETVLHGYNAANHTSLTFNEFAQWVVDHFNEFQSVITLYEPESKCDLASTRLRTIQRIYEEGALPPASHTSGISTATWARVHQFIRLWRKTGWVIHEVNLMLAALGQTDITTETVSRFEKVLLLKTASKLPLNQLAVLWGNIDTYGEKALYKKLFLNKSVQRIDAAFKADSFGEYLQREQDGNGQPITLLKHQSGILAAFKITGEELEAILGVAKVIDSGVPRTLNPNSDMLNIQNLSTIYRYVLLSKALKIRIVDMCKLIGLFSPLPFSIWDINGDNFANISPDNTYEFYKQATSIKKGGFRASTLEYIFDGTTSADSRLALDMGQILLAAKNIRETLAATEINHPDTPESTLTTEILMSKLMMTFQPDIARKLIEILEDVASFEILTEDNLNVVIPDDESQVKINELVATGVFSSPAKAESFLKGFAKKYKYINRSGRLTCAGVMTDIEKAVLRGLSNANGNFRAAVDELYTAPERYIEDNFADIFSDLSETKATLLDHPAHANAASLGMKLDYVYKKFLPKLKNKLQHDAIYQHVAAQIGLNEEATAILIAGDVDALISDFTIGGFSSEYFSDVNLTASVLERIDPTIDFSWGAAAPDPLISADNFSVRWKSYIATPASGEYTLLVDVDETDEAFKLFLDDTLILEKATGDANTSWEVIAEFNAAQMHFLMLEYAEASNNAGIRLRWKTTTTAPETLSSSIAYPASIMDGLARKLAVYHRAAQFISGFSITEAELNYFISHAPDFDNVDFLALTEGHWKRINDYVTLRNTAPQPQAFLTNVFALATSNPVPSIDQIIDKLHQATAWDSSLLDFLTKVHFSLNVDDFKNEIAINHLREVVRIVSNTGVSVETLALWGDTATDFDELSITAQQLKHAIKAKYGDEDWLSIAGDLSNKIRENQKQALISYLLVQPAIRAWGVKDADGLYEYLLIDVQMGACMDTSRIVQANAAVQMFVNRCLLNLESDITTGVEKGVSPAAIDKDRWEWMKNYRVWEANRKAFLYPENWLEPEWRKDRSEFFKELESYLVQNDITDRSVEQGLRNYLTSLNEVTNLDVCGMHRESYDDGKLKYLHVFARTHNSPYKYFYRRWNQHGKWSSWKKVQLDIRSVEDGGNSGVHLIPVVWKKRLFLFWPEFMKQIKESGQVNKNDSIENIGKTRGMAHLEPRENWEIRLAWSEYTDEKWSSKQVCKEFYETTSSTADPTHSIRFVAAIDAEKSLNISGMVRTDIFGHPVEGEFDVFSLSDITSKVEIGSESEIKDYEGNNSLFYEKYSSNSSFQLLNDIYLRSKINHNLLFSSGTRNGDQHINEPFFFSDTQRTYFVRPEEIQIAEWIRDPDYFKPIIPDGLVWDEFIPDYGPGDPSPIVMDDPSLPVVTALDGVADAMTQPLMMMVGGASDDSATPASTMKMSTRAVTIAGDSKQTFGYEDIGMLPGGFHTVDGVIFWDGWIKSIRDAIGLEFHTFYHPFSSKFVERLNQGGISTLMGSDTENATFSDAIKPDNGAVFLNAYKPNFKHGLVKRQSDFETPPIPRTAYMENVCFDVYGANSLYNWEMFFHAPLYIATRLSKNGKYEEAMKWFHYIFDPMTDEAPIAGEGVSRYWKVLPFKTTSSESLEDWFRGLSPNSDPANPGNKVIAEWRDNPFDPHLVASNRPLSYMKHVVIKYVENLIAWGDSLFRQFTRESVYEAIQLYVIANHVLGPRPEFVPKRGDIRVETYSSLEDKLDDFSNALVALENIFPYSSDVSVSSASPGTSMLGIGSALYFCIPENDRLLNHWDTVADRLLKIRHCQDIDGVERKLALFAPPIDPAALIQAASQGLSLGSILADLSSPPPLYRFSHLIQKCNEFCADVKGLGSALLAALEKKDAEELGRLRASHETSVLELVTAVRERQLLDAKANKENLLKVRETAIFRLEHYIDLLGNELASPPAAPMIDATLTVDTPLPIDTNIQKVETDVDESLVDSGESGVRLIPREKEELTKSGEAHSSQEIAGVLEVIASGLNALPGFAVNFSPIGVGYSISASGANIAAIPSAVARGFQLDASNKIFEGQHAIKMAGYIRREQDWTLQANLAAREIIQLDKQITSADIRIQVTEKELANHKQQIENAKQVELFLKDKFTNQELYQWMKEQLFSVFKQSYNLAFDMAKKAESAYKYELGTETASFIQYGYWDNSKQGLVSGEKLQLALRHMEKSYLEENRRELELSKSVSIALQNPLALIELRETGKCYVSLPEELFDLDYQGHYVRRIKSVSLSIPCISGPYTTVNCSMRLLKNTVRVNTLPNRSGNYEHENDEGMWIDDNRFRSSHVPVTSIATSKAQNDAGMFEFNFRDERYLPFEGAGAISDWQIELSTEKELRQFDYSTISDVILHLNYTARESGGTFKGKVVTYITAFIENTVGFADQPLMRMFSMRHEFPNEWHQFQHPSVGGAEQLISFTMGKERFPFFAQDRNVIVMKVETFARCTKADDYHLVMSYTKSNGNSVTSSQIAMPHNNSYGGLNKATINVNDAGLNLDELDVSGGMSIKVKYNVSPDFTSLLPDEVEDVFMVIHYKLGN